MPELVNRAGPSTYRSLVVLLPSPERSTSEALRISFVVVSGILRNLGSGGTVRLEYPEALLAVFTPRFDAVSRKCVPHVGRLLANERGGEDTVGLNFGA